MRETRVRLDLPRVKEVAERHGHTLERWSLLSDLTAPAPRPYESVSIGEGYEGGVVCSACGARAVVGTWHPWVESSLLRPCKVHVLFKADLRAVRSGSR
jgi:hypothetical protein